MCREAARQLPEDVPRGVPPRKLPTAPAASATTGLKWSRDSGPNARINATRPRPSRSVLARERDGDVPAR